MIDDKKVLKEIELAICMVGDCESCQFYETDGEQGQILSCTHDLADHLSYEIIKYLMRRDTRCPLWLSTTTNRTGYCKNHDVIYIHSCIACPQCWDEFVKKEIEEDSNE